MQIHSSSPGNENTLAGPSARHSSQWLPKERCFGILTHKFIRTNAERGARARDISSVRVCEDECLLFSNVRFFSRREACFVSILPTETGIDSINLQETRTGKFFVSPALVNDNSRKEWSMLAELVLADLGYYVPHAISRTRVASAGQVESAFQLLIGDETVALHSILNDVVTNVSPVTHGVL